MRMFSTRNRPVKLVRLWFAGLKERARYASDKRRFKGWHRERQRRRGH